MKTVDVYELINDRTKTAVENAKRAEQHHLQASCMLPFGVDVNPFTDVYKLLESLLWIRCFSFCWFCVVLCV